MTSFVISDTKKQSDNNISVFGIRENFFKLFYYAENNQKTKENAIILLHFVIGITGTQTNLTQIFLFLHYENFFLCFIIEATIAKQKKTESIV